jgi:hypothetical protein
MVLLVVAGGVLLLREAMWCELLLYVEGWEIGVEDDIFCGFSDGSSFG